ncbi:peptidoglycan DD-metalloendopeptidase family protein [Leptospira sp. GIMC2001]|uniref:peptidoglycan DD-metalloendopeptidase family protein n=1 Tax=Leptospira sp. GIMC2001 TaxID=1513297 RepID=UPI00234A18D4|nr:M23 family metallopeptidase [Leptospira sp. GIMC2001]WCL47933.1 LysM peptidoglycan-binding domain-containing M23 family metallopeptidase [Leptospira sp. GIMC2001]
MKLHSDSSLFIHRVDRFKVGSKSFIFILFLSLYTTAIFSNPFDKYEEELNALTGKQTVSFFNSNDQKVKHFFQSGNFIPSSDHEEVDLLDDLPKYIKYSAIVSSKIINEKGEIVKKHTVKAKDTLLGIAKTYGSDLARIKSKNGLKTDLIRLGDILEVPVKVANASRKKVVTKRIFINPVPSSRISSTFGRRKDPFNKYSRNFHAGLDMAAAVGTPVIASADGEVAFTGKNGGYGNTVIILHPDGYKTVYAHCAKIVVEVGEKVTMGRVIAAVGRTGTATGAHLHFEVYKNGKLINPQTALNSYQKIITKLPITEVAGL